MTEIITPVKDFKVGMSIRGFYLCKYVENKMTRLGDEYLDLILEDNSGTIRAKVWSFVDNFKCLFNKGDAVAVKGTIIKYNNLNEINISYINYADERIYKKYGYDVKKLVKKIDFDLQVLIKHLNNSINRIDSNYGKIVKKIIRENLEIIKTIPSKSNAYSLSGGYLLEIVDLLELNKNLFGNYSDLDESIIVSGLILKKIGLTRYFNNDIQLSVNDKLKNVDLRLISLNIVNEYFFESKYEDVRFILQNIILSPNDTNDINVRYINALYDFNNNVKNVKI